MIRCKIAALGTFLTIKFTNEVSTKRNDSLELFFDIYEGNLTAIVANFFATGWVSHSDFRLLG